MSGWNKISQLSQDIRCLVSDGERIYMGGYMKSDEGGFWYADDNAPLLSEDITHYMTICHPGKDMTGTKVLTDERLNEMEQYNWKIGLPQDETQWLFDHIRSLQQQVNTLTEALRNVRPLIGANISLFEQEETLFIIDEALQSVKE